jgi:hypothetical protein
LIDVSMAVSFSSELNWPAGRGTAVLLGLERILVGELRGEQLQERILSEAALTAAREARGRVVLGS